MKKLFLFTASLLLTANLMAVDYPLSVAGVVVTDAKKDDVLGDGTVSYDNDAHQLTLSNAHLTGSIWYHPAWAEDSEFSIYIVGKCSIILDGVDKAGAIYSQVARTNIVGFGTNPELIVSNIHHTGTSGIAIKAFANGSAKELSIDGLKVTATSDTHYAIDCSELNVKAGSFIEATAGEEWPALTCDMSKITYSETKLAYDLQNDPSGTLEDHNHIIIAPESSVVEYTDVLIKDQPITNYTMNDVMQNGVGDTWDASKKKLTLKGGTYSYSVNKAFFNFSSPATLALENGNYKSFETYDGPIIKTTADLTITGGVETFFTTYYGSCAIAVEPGASDVTLTFDKANITSLSGKTYSIQKTGTGTGAVKLAFLSSHVEMDNVNGIADANFTDCAIFGDGSGPFALDPDLGFVNQFSCDPTCEVMLTIRIAPDSYPVSVNAYSIYPYNALDIMGDGKLSYNHATKTLTVAEGADLIGGTVCPVVSVANQDLTILFKGKPLGFFGDYYQAIKMTNGKKLTLISAPGGKNEAIEIASNNTDKLPVIDADGADVEFRGVLPFKVQVDKGGAVDYYVNAPLIKANKLIVNAALVLNNPNTATEADVLANVPVELNENIELDGLDLQINTGTHEVEWKTPKSDKIREVVFVAKDLDAAASLEIAGIHVTKLNKGDILGDGKISYDEAAKKLTIDNATIIASAANAIQANMVPDNKLTIEVKGTNVLSCDKFYGIFSMVDLDIVGSGSAPYLSIDVEANGNIFAPIDLYEENLVVKDVTLLATTHHAAVAAISIGAVAGYLTVDNADLRAAIEDCDPSYLAINCNHLTLTNGSVLRYDDVVWPMVTWETNHFDGADRTHIWIGKSSEFPTDIENVQRDNVQSTKVLRDGQLFILCGEHIYNMQGMIIR